MTSIVYEVVHSWPEINTVGDYLNDPDSPAFEYSRDADAFLNVKNKNGKTNREVIEATYTSAEKEKYQGKGAKDLLLKVGTKLAIEENKANKAGLLTKGLEVVSNDIPAFKAKALAEMEANDTYKNVKLFKSLNAQKGNLKVNYPDATVWIWCRSLASEENNYEGVIFNVTPFVSNMDTNMSKNGGNFQLQLSPLVCEMSPEGKWSIKKSALQMYTQNKNLSQQGVGYLASDSLFKKDSEGKLSRNNFLFHNIISSNDLVFIRFETLQIEGDQRVSDARGLTVPKSNLAGRIYDMIGLVDENGITVAPNNTDVDISIQGRDLMKLFIEDGTYFYFLEVSQGLVNSPGGTDGKSNLMKRLVADKALQYLNTFYNNSIERVFEFVINQLSTIKVIPDSLLDSYRDRRNTRFETADDAKVFKPLDNEIQVLEQKAVSEIKRVRGLNQITAAQPERETLVDQVVFRHMKEFLKEIRDKKVRKVVGNITDGWAAFKHINERNVVEKIDEDTLPEYFNGQLYSVINTRVVMEIRPLIEAIDNILDIESSKANFKGRMEEVTAPGIWQIIKLVIDSGVAQRRLVDSSLSSANGSLLNFLRKVCQDPFVEFYGDTYGDMYYLLAKKPPTDQTGLLSMLKYQVNTETGKENSAIIDILEEDVLHESLSMNDSEVYSWYHLQPQANFYGGSDQFSLAYLPAIHLPEYAEIWGSKPMQLVHNYLPYIPKENGASGDSLDIIQRQAIEDLRYMINSTAYLPFTRKGTIKIRGDRRIKVGNIIRYKPTGEIFFVDGVKQSIGITSTIDRNTTIQVSRGMVEQLIYGVPTLSDIDQEATGIISYFNLVNTNPSYDYVDSTQKVSSRVKVGENQSSNTSSPYMDYKTNSISYTDIKDRSNEGVHLLEDYPPIAKQRFTQLINVCNEKGYKVIITGGLRDYAKQLALWRKNKSNAKPGRSQHENGSAIDINLVNKATGHHLSKSSLKSDWMSTGIPQMAKLLHMKWGGEFGAYDPVHFALIGEFNIGETITEDKFETRYEEIKGRSLDVTKIFKNFKVNKYVLNFFLRKQQFDEQYREASGRLLVQTPTGVVAEDTRPVIVRTIKKKNKK